MNNFSEGIFSNFKTMRRTGYTTNLAEMCKEKNCTMIFTNIGQAEEFRQHFKGLKCISLQQLEKMRGTSEPFYLDNGALEYILEHWEESEKSHTQLLVEHEDLILRNNLLFDEFIALRRQVAEEQQKNSNLATHLTHLRILSERSFFRKLIDKIKNIFGI